MSPTARILSWIGGLDRLRLVSALLILAISELYAQPAEPFQPDEQTVGLWHFDFSEPTEEWRVILQYEDHEHIFGVDVSNQGDYYVGGGIPGPEGRSMLIKLQGDGEVVWKRFYGEPGTSGIFRKVVCLEGGNIALFGENTNEGDEYAWLLIVDNEGEIVNSYSYTDFDGQADDIGPRGRQLLALEDGFLLAGTDSDQTFVCRTNAEGEATWQRSLGGNGLDAPGSIIQLADGGFLMAGAWSTADERDGWAVKLSAQGEIEWQRRYGDDISDSFSGVIAVNDKFIFAGSTSEQIGPANRWLVCTDQRGEEIWSRELGGGKLGHPFIARTGEIVTLCNYSMLSSLVKYPMAGDTIAGNAVILIDTLDFILSDLILNNDQSYVIVGSTLDQNFGSRILKTAPDIPLNTDYSTHQLIGIIHGNATPAEGRWGQALDLPLDGDGFITIKNAEELHLQTLSIECFLRMNGDVEHRETIVGKGYNEEFESFRLFTDNGQNLIGFTVFTDAGLQELTFQTDPADGEWHYIKGEFMNGVMMLYWDGNTVGESEVNGAVLYNNDDLIIGSKSNNPGASEPFWGQIDELRISGDTEGAVHPPQLLSLHRGWDIYSLYIEPTSADIRVILQPLVQRGTLVRIKDSSGRFYVPASDFCNIPAWDYHQGYQIMMAQADSLTVEGNPVAPDTPIQLRAGWNMAAYFPESSQSAQNALANLQERLILAKDGSGHFYTPAIGFSNMGDLSRGFGYHLKVTEGGDLVWHNPEGRR